MHVYNNRYASGFCNNDRPLRSFVTFLFTRASDKRCWLSVRRPEYYHLSATTRPPSKAPTWLDLVDTFSTLFSYRRAKSCSPFMLRNDILQYSHCNYPTSFSHNYSIDVRHDPFCFRCSLSHTFRRFSSNSPSSISLPWLPSKPLPPAIYRLPPLL